MHKLKIFRHAIQSLVVFGVFWLEQDVEQDLLLGKHTSPALIWIIAALSLVALLWAAEWLVKPQRDCGQSRARMPGGGRNSSPYFFAISITRGMSGGCCGPIAPSENPNGVPAQSPGLRDTRYPGSPSANVINRNAVVAISIHHRA